MRAGLPLLAAVVVGALGVFGWWSLRSAPMAPPPLAIDGAAMAAEPGTPAASEVAAAPGEALAAERDAVPPCRVHGVALDSQGRPLAGWQVYFEQPREPSRRPVRATFGPGFRFDPPALPEIDRSNRSQTSADDGTFAFDGVSPGPGTVWLAEARGAAVELALAIGQTQAIELRLPEQRCAVVCLVRWNGAASGGTEVRFVGADDAETQVRTDDHGRARALLAPGRYELLAYGHARHGEPGHRFVRGQRVLVVPPDTGTLPCTLELDESVLAVRVEDDTGAPVPDLTVEVTGSSLRGEDLSFRAESRKAAGVVHCELVPGSWQLAVSSPHLQSLAPQSLVIESGQRHAEVRVVGHRGGVVRLALRHVDGSRYRRALPVDASLEYLAATWNGTVVVPCLDPARSFSATKLSLGGVPFGNGTIAWRDRDLDGARVFLPFEPVAPMPLSVQAGDRNSLVVVVEPRAFVELIGCESMGRELVSGCVRVFQGAQEVRSLAKERPARWRSFLPPGEYRVCIDHDDGTTERFVSVQRRDLQLRLRR